MSKLKIVVFAIMISVVQLMAVGLQAQNNEVEIKADIFELNINTNSLIASGNVIATQADIIMTSPRSSYHQETQVLMLEDNVSIEKGPLSIQCSGLRFDAATQEIVGTGNVYMFFPPYSGRSDNIRYNNNIVTLSGSPILSKGDDELVAEEIVVDLINKKVYSKGYTKYKSSKDDN